MAKKIFYVSRTEDPQTGTAGAATLNRADQPQLMKVYDTVADAEADIANIDTNEIVGTKEVDLSSYAILNRVAEGNLNPVTSNAVANALSYSTTETLTGGKWIDGKPIYRKAGYKSTISNSEVVIDASLTSSYVDVLITAKASTTYYGKKIVSDWNSTSERLSLGVDTGGLVQLQNTLHLADVTGGLYWIVEYTKTGD